MAAAIRGLEPVDDREAASIEVFGRELARLDRPFDEDADPTHVTGSAVVIGPRGVLLHLHKRLGLWLQPGGHLDPGEEPWQAALREAIEETGLGLRFREPGHPLFHVDVHPAARGHTHLDLRYVLEGGDADPAPAPGESQDVRWFEWEEALAVADPGLVGALRKVRRELDSTAAGRRARDPRPRS